MVRKYGTGRWQLLPIAKPCGALLALVFAVCHFSPAAVQAQEVLLPLQRAALPAQLPTKTAAAVALPFFDDFAAGTVDPALWQNAGATVVQDVSPLAPTIGAATLDALDGDGNLYPDASTSLFPADTLTSMPLRLDGLTAADSVVLSFYYLPGGGYGNMWERVGDGPDAQDSLFLDFFCPADSQWVNVWYRGGISVDTLMAQTGSGWQYVVLPITDARWFDSLFRFRFRNYASLDNSPKAGLAGNCDYWHVDYVLIDRGRDSSAVPVFRDVAFAAPAPSMLQNYRAMPYNHYSAADMAANVPMAITNLYSSPLASHYEYSVYDSAGVELNRYDGGFENAPPYLPDGGYQTYPPHANPPVGANNFAFPAMTGPASFTVVHSIREGTGGDIHPSNDTVHYLQQFGSHYAYDDGTAENGYGLTSTASRLYLAYRFDLGMADTLTAVDIYFNRTLDEGNASIPFFLTVWSVDENGRPATVLYRDEARRFAQFGGFARYVLEAPVAVDGSIFVGFEQMGNNYLNIGYDRSFNSAERLWYLTGTEWQQSILSGSLMLRPGFGSAATVGVVPVHRSPLAVWPNPANDVVHIDNFPEGSTVQLYDVQGKRCESSGMVERSHTSCVIRLAALPEGLYLLQAVTPSGEAYSAKVIIKH